MFTTLWKQILVTFRICQTIPEFLGWKEVHLMDKFGGQPTKEKYTMLPYCSWLVIQVSRRWYSPIWFEENDINALFLARNINKIRENTAGTEILHHFLFVIYRRVRSNFTQAALPRHLAEEAYA